MKRYTIDIGILENCFDFCGITIEAENETEAVKKFFDSLTDEIRRLDFSKTAKEQDAWISEENKQ